jgi:hypothetical protein
MRLEGQGVIVARPRLSAATGAAAALPAPSIEALARLGDELVERLRAARIEAGYVPFYNTIIV